MSDKHKKSLYRILLATLVFIAVFIIVKVSRANLVLQALLYAIPFLMAGYDVLKKAVLKISQGKVFSEHFLMSLATLGAFALSFMTGESEFAEAVFVMIFYQVGEFFEHIAEGSSEKSISELLNLRPDLVHLEVDGNISDVEPKDVQEGQVIVIQPGEKVAIDGILISGESSVDTAALTGESLPQSVQVGDQVLSGMINMSGVIRVKVLHTVENSTLSKILDLLENSSANKSKSERFMSKFAAIYTPTVVIAALVLAFLPPLLSGNFLANFPEWLSRALTFLVISCPCALVISIPLSFFGGLGASSKAGVLIKGSNYLESLANLETLLLDKTGTLTEGVFEVTALHPNDIKKEHLLHLASHVERFSSHPIAQSLREAYEKEADDCSITDVVEKSGYGITAKVNGHDVAVGNTKFMDSLGADWKTCHKVGTIIHVAIDGKYAGHIVISDCIKSDTKEALEQLRKAGVKNLVMLTGDRHEVAEKVAGELSMTDYKAELLPADKVTELENYLAQKHSRSTVGFVGDGINDAPVLARADVGIAMGGLGSDVAIEAADVVVMNDRLSKIAQAIKIARKTITIARENIVFSIGIKVLVLILASLGLANMWLAIFADVGVTVLATLNAMRTMKLT
ncbi:MAG: cadmium-translocating P-type ATPase [Streptococcus equinus]|uniref:heavy metal translocating P-type ATPase n=1 Tax=Streptococcus equinus TaxID=1335 RepID=UPI0012FA0355|nr:heavy metal translocating P-type ATPase [Streptococcus equinus]MBE6163375.1 cadmium-translocating P-type ATPase [Streptococcus equinus]QGX43840.1 cadmium-translocating P-type ATPase [Streptococcus equinus]